MNQEFEDATANHMRRSFGVPAIRDWWRSAGVTARATVLGTAIAGLALLWTIFTSFSNVVGGNTTVINGNLVGGDMKDSNVEIAK